MLAELIWVEYPCLGQVPSTQDRPLEQWNLHDSEPLPRFILCSGELGQSKGHICTSPSAWLKRSAPDQRLGPRSPQPENTTPSLPGLGSGSTLSQHLKRLKSLKSKTLVARPRLEGRSTLPTISRDIRSCPAHGVNPEEARFNADPEPTAICCLLGVVRHICTASINHLPQNKNLKATVHRIPDQAPGDIPKKIEYGIA